MDYLMAQLDHERVGALSIPSSTCRIKADAVVTCTHIILNGIVCTRERGVVMLFVCDGYRGTSLVLLRWSHLAWLPLVLRWWGLALRKSTLRHRLSLLLLLLLQLHLSLLHLLHHLWIKPVFGDSAS